jgi:hypothetical protein
MVVIPAGSFMMGLPASENKPPEQPQHNVTVAKPLAVSKYELTFDEWDTCVSYGDCPQGVADSGFGRGPQPVINVTWDDAQRYVAWLSKMTGKTYRLLSEAEYEYAMRAGTTTAYSWGDDIGKNNADCDGAAANGTTDNRLRSAPSLRTSSASMTSWVMSSNGSRIVFTPTTMARRRIAPRGSKAATARPVSSAAVPGTALLITSVPRTAMGSSPVPGATVCL